MTPIYFSYLQGAGGKALINCLHLCPGVIFNEPVANFDQKFQRILSTVPDLDHQFFWSNYEIHNLIRGPYATWHEKAKDLDGYLPLVAHGSQDILDLESHIGSGVKIKISPSIKWIDTAIRIKWLPSPAVPQPSLDLDRLRSWEQDVEKIKFDITLDEYDPLQENRFDQHLTEVLDYLGLEPNTSSNQEYLQKYRDYHWSKIKQLDLSSYG